MTTPAHDTPGKVQDTDRAVEAMTRSLKAAGMHTTQINPPPVRPQTMGCPIMCTTGRHLTPEAPPTKDERVAAKLVNRFKRWVRGIMGVTE